MCHVFSVGSWLPYLPLLLLTLPLLLVLLVLLHDSGRYYCDPTCRGVTGEVDQTKPVHATGGENMKMRYVLPDIECDHCILQMVYRELVTTAVVAGVRVWRQYKTQYVPPPALRSRLARLPVLRVPTGRGSGCILPLA